MEKKAKILGKIQSLGQKGFVYSPIGISATILATAHKSPPPDNMDKKPKTKGVINKSGGEVFPTLRSNYWKMSAANAIHSDGRRAPFVIEIWIK